MRKDALENRQKILTIVRNLLDKQDLEQINMKQIANTADIGIGTLYRNYENKSALAMDLVYDDMEAFIVQSEHDLQKNNVENNNQFKIILTNYLNFREKNMSLLNQVENNAKQVSIFYQSDLHQKLVNIFKQAINELNPHSNAQELTFKADMLIAMLKSDVYSFERNSRNLSQNKILDNIINLFKWVLTIYKKVDKWNYLKKSK